MIDLEKKMSNKMENAEDTANQGLGVRKHIRRPQKKMCSDNPGPAGE